MSFHVSPGSQFTSELINFLKPLERNNNNQLPSGVNYGDYLYWDGSAYVVGDQQVSIGAYAGQSGQGEVAVAIGQGAGNQSQGQACVAIGAGAGNLNQGSFYGTGGTGPYSCCAVAVGVEAGAENQGFYSVAIGPGAGTLNQAPGSVALGFMAGQFNQGGFTGGGEGMNCCAIAMGVFSGQSNQGMNSIAIGNGSGMADQGIYALSIGDYAGSTNQGDGAIAIGNGSGANSQSNCSIALGESAGYESQGYGAISIGLNAGEYNQGGTAIAIGNIAGQTGQGSDAIAIGNGAGQNSQANQSIVINATGSVVDNTVAGTCKIAPLRDTNPLEPCFTEPYVMSYSPSTAEVTYNSNPQIQRSFGQGNELLLSDYNTVHYYSYSGGAAQDFDISTNMVENAVYEVTFNMSSASASNNDIAFYPNYTGGSHLYTNYIQRADAGTYQGKYENGSGFTFDVTNGSNGFDPVGKFTIFNNRNAKKIRSEIGDTFACSTGCGYWLTSDTTPTSGTPLSYDTATQWTTVGRITITPAAFTNAVVTVRRIA